MAAGVRPPRRAQTGLDRRPALSEEHQPEEPVQVEARAAKTTDVVRSAGGEQSGRQQLTNGARSSQREAFRPESHRSLAKPTGTVPATTNAASGTASAAERVQVAVRCRPFATDRQQTGGDPPVLAVRVNELLREVRVLQPAYLSGAPFTRVAGTGSNSATPTLSSSSLGATAPLTEVEFDNMPPYATRSFTYDKVFPMAADQEQVYNSLVRPIVNDSILGYNCTIFAYGQTGTGKTYTMEGALRALATAPAAEDILAPGAGIIPRAAQQIFSTLQSQSSDIEYTVRCSHLEIYNEQISDLLAPESSSATLRILQDPSKGTFVSGLEEMVVRNEHEIIMFLEKSSQRRHTAETSLNRNSSRSHAIFTITIHVREITPDGEDLLRIGKLNLVDLAGSENIGRSGATHERAREAGSINQSLLTLGRVINSLIEGQVHVPYRDSKLTRLLQESLGGRNKTAIIATISPEVSNIEETLNTLDYAFRAKNIRNRPTLNQLLMKKALIREYAEEIARLRLELEATRTKNGIYVPPELYAEMEEARHTHRNRIAALEQQIQDRVQEKEALAQLLEASRGQLTQAQEEQGALRRELEARETAISGLQQQLEHTCTQLDECRFLLDERVRSEELLAREAVALMNNLTQSLHDLDILHSKLEERDRQYVALCSRVREARTACQESMEEIQNQVRLLEERLDAHGVTLQARFEQCLSPSLVAEGDCEPSNPNKENLQKSLREENQDKQTGSLPATPKRRTWRYPRKLTRTGEEAILLATYRQRVAAIRNSGQWSPAAANEDNAASEKQASPIPLEANPIDEGTRVRTVHCSEQVETSRHGPEQTTGLLTSNGAGLERLAAKQRQTWSAAAKHSSAAQWLEMSVAHSRSRDRHSLPNPSSS